MSEDCTQISCPVPNDIVQDFANQYSLEGNFVTNTQFTAIINGAPVTIPAGTITIPFPPNSNPPAISYNGCLSPISIPIPIGSTQAQIMAIAQAVAQQAAAQQAQCNAGFPPGGGGIFKNQLVTFVSSCTVGAPLVISVSLPTGIVQNGNTVTLAAGMFSSTISQTDANNQASNYLTNFMDNLILNNLASCSAGCVDNQILTKTNNTFVAPGDGNSVNLPVINSALFVADSVTGYWLAQPVWDATPMAFVVDAIVDANTISITQIASGFFFEITGGTTVASGSAIYLSAYHGYVTTPPSIASVSIQNYSVQLLPALNAGCAQCPGSTTLWNGTFPNLDLAYGAFNEFAYEEGSSFGFTDKEILGNVVNAMFINTLYVFVAGFTGPWNLGYWALTIQCPGHTVLNAAKFGGQDATGVYYLVPGECLYPVFNSTRCLVVV